MHNTGWRKKFFPWQSDYTRKKPACKSRVSLFRIRTRAPKNSWCATGHICSKQQCLVCVAELDIIRIPCEHPLFPLGICHVLPRLYKCNSQQGLLYQGWELSETKNSIAQFKSVKLWQIKLTRGHFSGLEPPIGHPLPSQSHPAAWQSDLSHWRGLRLLSALLLPV